MKLSRAVLALLNEEAEARELLATWQARLALSHRRSRLERISPLQVTGEDGLPGAELVGVVIDANRFTIVHTRPLREQDIVHELLHVLRPEWSHEEVETSTDRLLAARSGLLSESTWEQQALAY